MGLFSFFNSKKKEEKKGFEFVTDFKKHLIDNLLLVNLPVDWIPYDSDRFRAKTDDGMLQMSLVNYQNNGKNTIEINSQFFKELKLDLYDNFVTEGEYEAYDDLKVTDSFITKSFKVDEETQYYYTTAKHVHGRLIITDIIVREIGTYNKKMQPLLQVIGSSIAIK
ncbi:hypothetical protein Q4599_04105 [Cellulophaga lytica]|uniref:DUF1795 domain-containing protein n=1 Tax=Cellulophaga lytica (strain ATCC 23178 / DSM 7489 / JCM 8516 / NBRC 14961 / NCIMB 1423 / VKM B-1433 / Cy l20) TaxID=867900 RepID=F0RDC1_CELLC|nr:hypothetical protein [Cellulophaga lytica]ADY30863.1 hypothetical protein Celly_3046 [Cellulophaga lytica DSM 7489]MDO6852749.1 hypothetical protein [Cellulophaga lytica]WQG78217.1 hypothetical protein SR888_04650 [Cellulophaga lytica]